MVDVQNIIQINQGYSLMPAERFIEKLQKQMTSIWPEKDARLSESEPYVSCVVCSRSSARCKHISYSSKNQYNVHIQSVMRITRLTKGIKIMHLNYFTTVNYRIRLLSRVKMYVMFKMFEKMKSPMHCLYILLHPITNSTIISRIVNLMFYISVVPVFKHSFVNWYLFHYLICSLVFCSIAFI